MMGFTKTDSYETMLEAVNRAAWREFDRQSVFDEAGVKTDPGFDAHVIGTFQNAVIIKDACSDILYEVGYMLNGDSVIFGQPREVAEMYVEKRMAEAGLEYPTSSTKSVDDVESIEVAGPIVRKNAALRIGYAAVLVPGEPDSDGEVLSAEKIEEVAHGWMESYRNVDLMHTLNNTGVPVESYILPEAMKVVAYGEPMLLPAGSWILASKLSEEAWSGVESGVLTGYSVMGIKRAHLTAAMKTEEDVLDETAFKRTLLEDLGPEWIASHVSVVDHPAVPKAKFFALKSKEYSDDEIASAVVKAAEESPSFLAKLSKALGFAPKSVAEAVVEVSEGTEDVVVEEVVKSEDSTELKSAEKAGRKLSAATLRQLEECKKSILACHNQIDAIISGTDAEDSMENEIDSEESGVQKSVNTEEISEGPVTDMDEAQLQAIVAEAVKSAVEPLTDRLDALEAAPKSEAPEVELEVAEVTEEPVAEKAAEDEATPEDVVEKAEEAPEAPEVTEEVVEKAAEAVEEPVEEPVVEKSEEPVVEEAPVVEKSEEEIAAEEAAKKAEEEAAAEDAAFKAQLVEALDKIEQLEKRVGRVTTSSKSLPNDGGGGPVDESEEDSGRDAFGRRIR